MNDVAQRRTADKIKWITSHKRKGRLRSRRQNRHVVWGNNDNLVHRVAGIPIFNNQIDGVSEMNILECPEESIAVSRETDIAGFARGRSRRAINVPDRTIEGQVVRALQHGDFEVDRRES